MNPSPSKLSNRLFYSGFLGWFPLALYTFLVFKGAVASPEDIPEILIDLNDKLVHAIEYFLLFFFSLNAFLRTDHSLFEKRSGSFALIYTALIGVITEWIQIYTPGRSSDLVDWIVDVLGALMGWGLYQTLKRYYYRVRI
jgi:VanZ family protein